MLKFYVESEQPELNGKDSLREERAIEREESAIFLREIRVKRREIREREGVKASNEPPEW